MPGRVGPRWTLGGGGGAGGGAQALSVAFMNPLVGILAFVNCWFTSFLFCGFFLPEDDIPWPLKVGRVRPSPSPSVSTVRVHCRPSPSSASGLSESKDIPWPWAGSVRVGPRACPARIVRVHRRVCPVCLCRSPLKMTPVRPSRAPRLRRVRTHGP